ncbi:MAG: VanZ family protein [Treponema sp.]|nr:VanZ family protein [Treponema sp.]
MKSSTLLRIRLVISGVLFFYTALLFYWMFFGFGRTTQNVYSYNLVPFSTIERFLYSKNIRYHLLINIFGNIGVFVPFGILLRLCFQSSFVKTLAVFLLGVLCLETLQLVFRRGTFDVDDVMLNTAGFLLGWLAFMLGRRLVDMLRCVRQNRRQMQRDKATHARFQACQ